MNQIITFILLYDVGENTQHQRCNRSGLAVISNVSSGAPEKNVNDVALISVTLNPVGVISNVSSGAPEKNVNDVALISVTPNPVSVMSTIGDI